MARLCSSTAARKTTNRVMFSSTEGRFNWWMPEVAICDGCAHAC
ncbi:hypothetical protein DM52_2517 [Burkholderia mallei]|nr:hypothetical protein DM52_2517 [Burkholderia mallei]